MKYKRTIKYLLKNRGLRAVYNFLFIKSLWIFIAESWRCRGDKARTKSKWNSYFK